LFCQSRSETVQEKNTKTQIFEWRGNGGQSVRQSADMNSFDCRSLDSYYLGEEEQYINPIHLISTLENDPENGFVEMVQFLRSDDFRIVRIGPSPASRKNQRFIENIKNYPENILKFLAH
jgi:hypothetical protein